MLERFLFIRESWVGALTLTYIRFLYIPALDQLIYPQYLPLETYLILL